MTDVNKENEGAADGKAESGKPRMWTVSDFDLGKCLGYGRFGNVFVARETRSRFVVALKILTTAEINEQDQHQVRREVEIQYHIRHENVLRLYGYFYDSKRLYMVLQYANNGSLFQLLRKRKTFSTALAAYFFLQLVDAVAYIHSLNVLHRDIKLENMLLADRTLKLADFGWACHTKSSKLQRYCGTPDYLAPEMVRAGEKPYDFGVDVWAVGVAFFEFLVGQCPFGGRPASPQRSTLYTNICQVRFECPPHMPAPAQQIINGIFVVDPKKRMSLSAMRDNHWLNVQKKLVRDDEFPDKADQDLT